MSKVLLIRHFPNTLSHSEKRELMHFFGAVDVWSPNDKSNSLFASFKTEILAEKAMNRLHQMELDGRRLIVEYSMKQNYWKDNNEDRETPSAAACEIRHFLNQLNSWNSSVDFYQPPPPNVAYSYPECNPRILLNIMYIMSNHRQFYIQTLHLMNKMSLDLPFGDLSDEVLVFCQKDFHCLFPNENATLQKKNSSESELSSDGENYKIKTVPLPSISKVKQRKRLRLVPSLNNMGKVAKKSAEHKNVFEEVQLHEPKKINVKSIEGFSQINNNDVIIGTIGMINNDKNVDSVEKNSEYADKIPKSPDIGDIVTTKNLLDNKVSINDMKILPVFKNYHPGVPSEKLYIKNLSKSVNNDDLKRIYMRYVNDNEINKFDLRLMQEGRMKGQAFIILPSVSAAEKALKETNGYILRDKPIVVQFSKMSNK